MGLFTKKKPAAVNSGSGKVDQRLIDFSMEIMKCLSDDGKLDIYELDRLRRTADRLGLSKDDILNAKVVLTAFTMNYAEKQGYSKKQANEIAAQVIVEVAKI